jgi:CRP/FNR family cyclic AMP-dependent transcriptional regulator
MYTSGRPVVNGLASADAAACSEAIWRALSAHVTRRRYAVGTTVVRQATPPDTVFRIASGLVKILHRHPSGEEVVVGLRASDWPISQPAPTARQFSPVTIVALTDLDLIEVACAHFLATVTADGHLRHAVARLEHLELSEQLDRLAMLTRFSARRRLLHVLRWLAHRFGVPSSGGAVALRVSLTQEELAQTINVTRETLTRLLVELEKERVVRRQRGWITLLASRCDQDHITA